MRMTNPPTALFTSNYLMTLGAIRALHDLQREQQNTVGFGDIVVADLLRPAITVMAPDPAGSTIAKLSESSRDWTVPPPVQTVVVAAKLIARGSGEIPPPGH